MKAFEGNFTQQGPIGEDAIAAAVSVMRSGRLHRYNTLPGEKSLAETLEARFAAYQGARYCLACASGGYAMAIALRAAGLASGEAVLTNAFTLAPVPGAIVSAGGRPVLVEIDENLTIDLADLEKKFEATGARFLLLSSMRGHLVDMPALVALVARFGARLIEDCAHTMGATWDGRKSGSFGIAGCFSTQTYKHMNSGEGGLLTSDDADFMARAIILSGSYMLYERHGAAPDRAVFDRIRLETPNMSGRMDNLRAAILLPQIETLDANIARWNERYAAVAERLSGCDGLVLPERPSAEGFVGSSIQFRVPGIASDDAQAFVGAAARLGVDLKWFGAPAPVAFTSNHRSWRYMDPQTVPRTDAILSGLFDMRLPLTFSLDDCAEVAEIICHCHRSPARRAAA